MGKKKRLQKSNQKAKNQPLKPKSSFWKENIIPSIVLVITAFLLYGYSLGFEYVLDDKIVLSENSFVKKGTDGIADIFKTESFTGYLGSQQDLVVGARYRPFSIATFALEYELFGLNPWVGHFGNILLYALTALLIFRILSSVFTGNKKWHLSIPFIASFLFLLHPVHTEVVANIKGRDEILATLLAFWTLWLCLRFYDRPKFKHQIAIMIVFFFALLAKESAITFLAVIPASIFIFKKVGFRKLRFTTVPLLISTSVYLVIRYKVIGYLLNSGKEVTGLMNNPFLGTTLSEKYATITYTLGKYVQLLVYPHPLTHDYYPYQIPIVSWSNIWVIISLLLTLIFIGVAIYGFKKRWLSSWAALYYLATLSIVSNVVFPIGTFMNERFIYMPSFAFIILLSYFLVEKLPKLLQKNKSLRYVPYFLIIAISGAYAFKTIDRLPAWQNEMELNKAAIEVSTESARANQFMGYSLYRKAVELKDSEAQKALYDKALPYIEKSLSIHPTYPDALTTYAGIMAGYYQQNNDLNKLLDEFYEIQNTNPIAFVDTYLNYLEKRSDKRIMLDFYTKLATSLNEKGNIAKSNYYKKKAAALRN